MVTCYVVNSACEAADLLAAYIRKVNGFSLVAVHNTAEAALESFQKGYKPDVIFLDVQIIEMRGLDVVDLFPQDISIIIVTEHEKYAVEAFEKNILDFLLKPISFDRFLKSANKIQKKIADKVLFDTVQNQSIFVTGIKKKIHQIRSFDILYVEAYDHYIFLHTIEGRHIVHSSMKEILKELPQAIFCQIHRSFIVNVVKIRHLEKNTIFIDKLPLPISHSFRRHFLEKFLSQRRNQ